MKRFKFVLGLAAGLLLGSTIIVGANQTIQALLNDEITIIFDDVAVDLKDEVTGSTLYPITYNDRTYLPVRKIADMLDLKVVYDDAERLVKLSDNRAKRSCDHFYINDFDTLSPDLYMFAHSNYNYLKLEIVSGNKRRKVPYSNYVALETSNLVDTYNIDTQDLIDITKELLGSNTKNKTVKFVFTDVVTKKVVWEKDIKVKLEKEEKVDLNLMSLDTTKLTAKVGEELALIPLKKGAGFGSGYTTVVLTYNAGDGRKLDFNWVADNNDILKIEKDNVTGWSHATCLKEGTVNVSVSSPEYPNQVETFTIVIEK